MSLSLKDNCFNGDAVTLQKFNKVVRVHIILEERNIKRSTMSSMYEVKKILTLFPEGDAQQI